MKVLSTGTAPKDQILLEFESDLDYDTKEFYRKGTKQVVARPNYSLFVSRANGLSELNPSEVMDLFETTLTLAGRLSRIEKNLLSLLK